MTETVRWTGIAFVLGLCVAYALWAPRPAQSQPVDITPPPPAPTDPAQQATTKPTSANFPLKTALRFTKETVEFGEVPVNEKKMVSVTVENTGTKPITVTRMQQSCGCLRLEMPVKIVEPGKAEPVLLTFHAITGKRAGELTAALTTDEPGNPTIMIVAKGTVREYFEIKPAPIVFDILNKGETATRTTSITSRDGKPFIIKSVNSQKDCFDYRWEAEPSSNNTVYKMHIKATGRKAGSFIDQAGVLTDHPVAPMVLLTATVDVRNDVLLTPSRVAADQSHDNKISPFEVTLTRRTPGKLTVESITENENLPLKFTQTELPDGSVKVAIEFTKAFAKAVPFGEFRIKTNAEDELLRLPYRLKPQGQAPEPPKETPPVKP